MDDARVLIGNNVAIGPNVSLMATNHPLIASERMGVDDHGRTTMAEFASGIHKRFQAPPDFRGGYRTLPI